MASQQSPLPVWLLIRAFTEALGSNADPDAAADAADDDYRFGPAGGHGEAASGNGSGDKIYRLREGIERFIVSDIGNPCFAEYNAL